MTDFTNRSYWDTDGTIVGVWDAANNRWYSEQINSPNDHTVLLEPSGSWVTGFRPNTVSFQISGSGDVGLEFYIGTGPDITNISASGLYESTISLSSDITRISFVPVSTTNQFIFSNFELTSSSSSSSSESSSSSSESSSSSSSSSSESSSSSSSSSSESSSSESSSSESSSSSSTSNSSSSSSISRAYSDTDKIRVDAQKLNVGSGLVELFKLDATALGGSITYFTPATSGGQQIVFGGITYSPLPVQFEGVQQTNHGALARPTIRVGNVNKDLTALIRTSNQLLGATLTRKRTFEKYLDNGTDPTPAAIFPQDVYIIERMVSMSKLEIEWELRSEIDLENVFLPKRQCLDLCSHTYRYYSGGSFVYTDATCPYTGTNYFDLEDTATTADLDVCSKKLNACQARFGTNTQLPFKGFPAVGKIGYPYR